MQRHKVFPKVLIKLVGTRSTPTPSLSKTMVIVNKERSPTKIRIEG
jgi:hypothetical protein